MKILIPQDGKNIWLISMDIVLTKIFATQGNVVTAISDILQVQDDPSLTVMENSKGTLAQLKI